MWRDQGPEIGMASAISRRGNRADSGSGPRDRANSRAIELAPTLSHGGIDMGLDQGRELERVEVVEVGAECGRLRKE